MLRVLYALPLLISAAALAQPTAHEAWVRARLASLPRFHEDRSADGQDQHLAELARAIADESRGKPLPPQQWSALILTVGQHESGFSMRIVANKCKSTECDRGKARGFGQVHANALNRDDWERAAGDVRVQAKLTSDALKRAYLNCRNAGGDVVRSTLSSYAGQRCGANWAGLDARMKMFGAIVGRGGKS